MFRSRLKQRSTADIPETELPYRVMTLDPLTERKFGNSPKKIPAV